MAMGCLVFATLPAVDLLVGDLVAPADLAERFVLLAAGGAIDLTQHHPVSCWQTLGLDLMLGTWLAD